MKPQNKYIYIYIYIVNDDMDVKERNRMVRIIIIKKGE